MATHSSILAWRIPVDRGAWWATVHGVAGVGHDERLAQLWLFYNVPRALQVVSIVQQSDSATRMHVPPLFWISFL